MKRILSLFIILMMGLLIITGCSTEEKRSKEKKVDFVYREYEIPVEIKEILSFKILSSGEVKVVANTEYDINSWVYYFDYTNGSWKKTEEAESISKEVSGELYTIEDDNIISICESRNFIFCSTLNEIIKINKDDNSVNKRVFIPEEINDSELMLYESSSEEYIYAINGQDLYKYLIEEEKVEKIIEKISPDNLVVKRLIEIEENNFLVLFYDRYSDKYVIKSIEENYNSDEGDINTLTIYSLYENRLMSQIISLFKFQNSDLEIKYEVGIDNFQSSQTVSDEIKRLNTEIASGKGPDIIVLDQLPYKSYIEKGALINISEIVREICEDNSIFENIIKAYNGRFEEIYLLPLRFGLPIITGEGIDGVNNLKLLGNKIKALVNSENKNILNIFKPADLIWLLYRSCGEMWINDDKTINTEKIEEFLNNAKDIYNEVFSSHSDEDIEKNSENRSFFGDDLRGESYSDITYYDYDKLENIIFPSGSKLTISSIKSIYDLAKIEAVKKVRSDFDYEFWNGQAEPFVIPLCNIGINVNSKNIEFAKEFIKYGFKEESQKISNEGGIPLNINAFRNLLGSDDLNNIENSYSIKGEKAEIEVCKLDDKFILQLEQYIKGVKNISNPDKDVLNKILDKMELYIYGDVDIDEAMDGINKDILIYIQE